MNQPECGTCKVPLLETEYGTLVCGYCGIEDFRHVLYHHSCMHTYCVPIHSTTTYTRLKRFKKYLNRSSMSQSKNSVPRATWDYLMQNAPYTGPRDIVRTLKKAPKTVKKKCYDSLPLLVHSLCPDIHVPRLSENEKYRAIQLFMVLDRAYKNGEPFVSYLFALEYILKLIERDDVLNYLNKISCSKRRRAYTGRLNRIFSSKNQEAV
jgi:hypothetical protein